MQYFRIRTFPFDENIYIYYDEQSLDACIIDPGGSFEKIREFVNSKKLKVKSVILTHGHADHIGALQEIIDHYKDIEVIAAKREKKILNSPAYNLTINFGMKNTSFEATRYVEDGDTYQIGGKTIKFIVTPGHTSGSMCVFDGEIMFTGDTLFEGSIGRTDLPTGSYQEMENSLKKLSQMNEDIIILPGHGEQSSIGQEKKYNPFLRQL
jgi:metallo-beta-lactamase